MRLSNMILGERKGCLPDTALPPLHAMRPCLLHSFPMLSRLLPILDPQLLEEDIRGIVDGARIALRRTIVLAEPFERSRLALRCTWRVQLSRQVTTESRLCDSGLLHVLFDLPAYLVAAVKYRHIIVLLLYNRDTGNVDACSIPSFFDCLGRLLIGGGVGLLLLRHLLPSQLALLEELPSTTVCIAPCALHGPMLGKKPIHRFVADTEGAAEFSFLFTGGEVGPDLATYLVAVLVDWPAIEAQILFRLIGLGLIESAFLTGRGGWRFRRISADCGQRNTLTSRLAHDDGRSLLRYGTDLVVRCKGVM